MTASRQIPFFNYPALFERHRAEFLQVFEDVAARGAFILQRDLEEFEAALASYLDVRHAFGVADGSNAIAISLLAAGLEPGDEVILPSHTFIATAAAVHGAGGVPVLADCGPDHMLDVTHAATLVTERTRALVPVQLNGRTCQMDEVQALVQQHGLILVEDAAQALGATFDGKAAGSFGSAGTFSFYPAKLLGCFGDGGGIITNDDAVAERVYMLRDHGRDKDGEIKTWGFNSRLDNLQAAFLSMKLRHFDDEVRRRREIAARYQELLGDLAALVLPPGPGSDERRFDVFQNYEIEASDRDGLKAYLADHGVGSMVQWGGTPVHAMKALGFTEAPPYTESMFGRCLMVPLNTTLSDEDVEYVAGRIRSFYEA